ncbi:MAG: DMT family transporter [Candidatus Competibacteraceae bacterium]|jgi:drug/metabolite transporter (DMT)-like permease|nr:DMT family transporter [Candidatus Competibacteraceae bacterium]
MNETAHTKALFSVLTAGTLWSFGALTIRYMVDPQAYRWQYLFFRGLTIAAILCLYLVAKDGRRFFDNFKRIGVSGVIGACGLVGAFTGFIWSITLTTAANTLFLFATIPFLAAFMGIVILKEKIRPLTWGAMTVALIGITVMVLEGLETGSVLGTVTGFAAACGFSTFSVCLRWRKETPQFATVALAGFLCAVLTAGILVMQSDSVLMPDRNIYLSMVHGTLVGAGLILFSLGAKYFPAAELNLLSLVEVVGGVVWVYLPVFGINEVPSMLTVVGGSIVTGAIILDSVGTRYPREAVKVTGHCRFRG